MEILRVNANFAENMLPGLADLLKDSVDSGASVGFLPPLSLEVATAYWEDILNSLDGVRVLLIAQDGEQIAGSVQIYLEPRANGNHRAEIQKLMVHTDHRRKGIGRQLMQAAEAIVHDYGRTLIVLDTRPGDIAEGLYTQMGYQTAGFIPQYARSADGSLDATVFMYRILESNDE